MKRVCTTKQLTLVSHLLSSYYTYVLTMYYHFRLGQIFCLCGVIRYSKCFEFWDTSDFRFFGSGKVNQNLRLGAGHWPCIPTCKPTIPETKAGDCRHKVILGDTEILSQENMNVSVLNFFQSAWHIWDPSVTTSTNGNGPLPFITKQNSTLSMY